MLSNNILPEKSASRDCERFIDDFGNIENLKCSICLMIPYFEDAIEHKDCAHVFCSECLGSLKKSECPLCGFPMSSNRKIIQDNIFIYRLMKSFRTKCDRIECKKVVEWGNLTKHLASECDFGMVECKLGCGKQVLRKDEASHQEECDKRKIQCDFCQNQILFCEKKTHLEAICLKSPFMKFTCKFVEFGCLEKYEKNHEEEHLKQEQWRHMTMMMEGFTDKIKKLQKENEFLKERIDILEGKNKKKDVDLWEANDKIESENLLEKDYLCVVCGEKAKYLCCNRENAKDVYKNVCNYLCCEKHTSHNSDECKKQGRECAGASHNCDMNTKFCGLVSLFGVHQK
jgi:hypothetical protein